jgi:hypothetical protein
MSKFSILASIVGLAFIGAFITNPLDVGSKAATEPAPVAAKQDRYQILGLRPGTVALRVPMADPDQTGPDPRAKVDLRLLVPTPAKST